RLRAVRHPDRGEDGQRRDGVPSDLPGRRRGGAPPAAARAAPPAAPVRAPPPASADPIGARAYHDATRHSPQSARSGGHFLDGETKPFPFKVYPDAPAASLPREVAPPATPALEALRHPAVQRAGGRLDLGALATLLFFSAGLTKRKAYPGGETIHF